MGEERCWNDLATRVHELEAENVRTKELLGRALRELRHLTHGECCDHAANICWCATFQTLKDIQAAIGKTHTQTPFSREGAPK